MLIAEISWAVAGSFLRLHGEKRQDSEHLLQQK